MNTILVPVDFSDAGPDVMAAAVTMAKAFNASVLLLHVAPPEPEFLGYDPGPQSVRDSVARQCHEAHSRLQAAEKNFSDQGIAVTALLIQGYPVEKILHEAEKHHPFLIVMGSHGHGALRNLLVGSVTEGVMRRATCPVLVVPHRVKPNPPLM
ncbi:MAG TPA: universal stress protein [Kiritimatiellia bacterium]|nr:universal stress protein [Kiritimatiellia bacterium]HMP00600.1 universal stress protein [Kiritimatiellia bacterium]HMP97993.1 universal stress protein [Kiritimatiellia bacterium]